MFKQLSPIAVAACLFISQVVSADPDADLGTRYNPAFHCGEGTITGVIVGGWGWSGLHLAVDWADGRAPASSALFAGNLVRFLQSDLNEERMKKVTAVAMLAQANEYYVRFASGNKVSGTGDVNCGRATEIHIAKRQ